MTVDRTQFRDRSKYAGAVASEAIAPLLRAGARLITRGAPTPPSTWRTGLILGNGHIGDVLYRTCSLDLLARTLPNCRWTYLTTPLAAEVLVGNPALSDVVPQMTSDAPTLLDRSRRGALRLRQFDVALCTENVRHHWSLLLATLLGVPNRVAFTQKGFSGLATRGVHLSSAMARPAQFRYMIESLGAAPSYDPLRPRVYSTANDVADAEREWYRVYATTPAIVIACAMTTRQAIGVYPPEFFASLLTNVLREDRTVHVLLVGSGDDRDVLNPIAQQLGDRCAVSAGVLGPRTVVSLLTRCHAFVGSDSGPRHLANAAGIPVFFVRNMGTSAIEAGAYCSTERDIAPHGEFLSPTEMREALRRVNVPDVARAIVQSARQPRVRDTLPDTPR